MCAFSFGRKQESEFVLNRRLERPENGPLGICEASREWIGDQQASARRNQFVQDDNRGFDGWPICQAGFAEQGVDP